MAREIKFRGKTDNGNWLFGEIISLNNHKYIAPEDGDWFDFIPWVPNNVFHAPDSDEYEVDKETIGQYIGMRDKNGEEIYEGDIVYVRMRDGSDCYCVIGFNEELLGFGIMDEYAYHSKMQGHIRNFDNGFMHRLYKDSLIFEVRGNIHDNPKLIKVEDLLWTDSCN